jgi:hypothetical protein
MTDDSRWEPGASGDSNRDSGSHAPWYPPAGPHGTAEGGYGQPGYGQPGYGQPGYRQPGGYGEAGWYGPPGAAGPPPGGWPRPPQAPRPGVIPLRPLGVGEILDGAFTTIRRNPRATLGIAAILLTISGVITTVATVALGRSAGPDLRHFGQQTTPGQLNGELDHFFSVWLPLLSLSAVLYFVVDLVLTGVLTVVIGRSVLGHTITAGEAWKIARPRLPALLGVTLLIPLVLVAPWVAWGIVLIALALAQAPGPLLVLFGVLGAIAAFAFSLLAAVRLRMAGPAVVLERQRPWPTMRRSWRLVSRSFWRVFGITLLAALIVGVTAAILQIPFGVVAALTNGGTGASPLGIGASMAAGTSILAVIISAIGGIFAGSVTRPIAAGVAVLLYVDLRMRREGFDLVLQTASAASPLTTGDELASLWRPDFPAYGHVPPPAGQGGTSPTW